MPRRRARSGRRRRNRSGTERYTVPFTYSSTFGASASLSKFITAGDLGLSNTRPLLLKHIRFQVASTSPVTFRAIMIATSQEGTVSRPYTIAGGQRLTCSLTQGKSADFGVYGSSGALLQFTYNSVLAGSLLITGEAVLLLKRDATLHVVS